MPLRVVHVISSPEGLGGAERVLLDLLAGGEDRGYEQLVLHPFARDGGRDLAAAMAPTRHRPLPCAGVRGLPALRRQLGREIRAHRPDVVHAHLFHAGVLVGSLRLPGALRVWTHHHGSVMRDQRRRVGHLLDCVSTRRYDEVVAVSGSVREFLVNDCHTPASRVHIIRNGWAGTPRPRDGAGHRPTVVSVGNFRPEKAQVHLVQAIAEVRDRIPDVRLVLLGEGPLRSAIETTVRDLSLTENVTLAGHVPDVWPHLAEADVFALASVHEPLGIAALEAMAAGLPTVTTDAGGLPEVVDSGVTGVLVPARDPSAMASALVSLLRDEALRRRMGAAASERAAGMRSAAMVAAYADLYERGVAHRQHRPTEASR